jgi:hypothetical protein
LTLTKAQREKIRAMFECRCAYCGIALPEKGWHADHVQAIYRSHPKSAAYVGSDSVENIFPACKPCNLFKSVHSLEGWRAEIAAQVDRARRSSFNFRFAEKFGLVCETRQPVTFYFERFATRTREEGQ